MCAATETEADGWAPDLPKVETYEQEFPVSDSASYLLKMDLDERNRLVEWAVIQLRSVNGRKMTVAVYDTCHEKGVHVHHYDREGERISEEVLQGVASYRDLEEGLDYAVKRASEAWRENERRCDRGH